jgi:hypothetical protein
MKIESLGPVHRSNLMKTATFHCRCAGRAGNLEDTGVSLGVTFLKAENGEPLGVVFGYSARVRGIPSVKATGLEDRP